MRIWFVDVYRHSSSSSSLSQRTENLFTKLRLCIGRAFGFNSTHTPTVFVVCDSTRAHRLVARLRRFAFWHFCRAYSIHSIQFWCVHHVAQLVPKSRTNRCHSHIRFSHNFTLKTNFACITHFNAIQFFLFICNTLMWWHSGLLSLFFSFYRTLSHSLSFAHLHSLA